MKVNEITEKIIGLAIKVHKELGPGFLETVYQTALAYEFRNNNLGYEKEKTLPVYYGDIFIEMGFRCDFLIEDKVILECKTTKIISDIDIAQVLNYLKITDLQVGLIINFNTLKLVHGIKRIVNNFDNS